MRMQRRSVGVGGTVATVVLVSCLMLACGQDKTQALAGHLAKGDALSEQGKYTDAVIEYRNAVAADPRSGEARYRLSMAYLAAGDGVRAIQEASRAADLLPDRNDVQLHAGRLLLLGGGFEDAAERARGVLKRDLRNVDALMLLGNASAGLSQPDDIVATITAAAKELPQEPGLQAALGAIERRRGNIVEAEASFKNAVVVAPKSVDAHLGLANFYWSVGRPDDVERVLKAALDVDPSDAVARNLAFFYTLSGRQAEAKPYLEKLMSAKPDDAVVGFALADLYAREGSLAQARGVLEPLVANEVVGTMASVRLANLEYQAGQKDTAYKRLETAAGRSKGAAEVSAMRARMLFADGKLDEALAAAKASVASTPQWAEGHYLVGAIQLDRGQPDEAVTALREAERLAPSAARPKTLLSTLALRRGDLDAAVNFAADAVRLLPEAPLPRVALAKALVAKRDVGAAEEALKPVLAGAGNVAEVQVLAGSIAQLKGDRESARLAYTRASELAPASYEAFAGLVGLEIDAGRIPTAIGLVTRRLATSPRDPGVLLLAARVHMAARDWKQAEELLNRAIAAAPDDLRAYEPLAGLYFQQGRLADAADKFKALAKAQPKAIGPPTMLGIILQLQGKPREAQTVYEELLARQPESPIAANNLAMLLLESGGNVDVALNHAQTAKRLLPNDPDITDTLGMAYLKKGLGVQAGQMFSFATQTKPNRADFWLHLGQARALAENKDGAREALQKAIMLEPKGANAEQAKRSLAELK